MVQNKPIADITLTQNATFVNSSSFGVLSALIANLVAKNKAGITPPTYPIKQSTCNGLIIFLSLL